MRKVIECTNCGGGGTDAQFWITVGALVIAFIALVMNFVQFREYLRGLRSRAEFKVTLRPASGSEDGVRRTQAQQTAVRVALGIKNDGKKAAGETLVNALVPSHLENVRWCGPTGQEVEASSVTTPTDDEKLTGPDGIEYEAKYLSRMLPRVGTKPHHLLHFQFYVHLAEPGKAVIPVRVKVQADEIPDDIEDYVEELEVHVVRIS